MFAGEGVGEAAMPGRCPRFICRWGPADERSSDCLIDGKHDYRTDTAPLSRVRGPAVSDPIDRRADTTRLQILRAASRQFARKSYSLVSLDNILADAEVTKGAMYFHFRSKHALATAIIDIASPWPGVRSTNCFALKLSGLETLIDITYFIAV